MAPLKKDPTCARPSTGSDLTTPVRRPIAPSRPPSDATRSGTTTPDGTTTDQGSSTRLALAVPWHGRDGVRVLPVRRERAGRAIVGGGRAAGRVGAALCGRVCVVGAAPA